MDRRSALFLEALDVDEVIAHLLIAEGFTNIQEVAETPIHEMMAIEGFDADIGQELIDRAQAWLDEKQKELEAKTDALGIQSDLIEFEGLDAATILKLGEAGVKSRDDLADLATDELVEILGEGAMTNKEAESLIMRARAHWFEDEETQPEAEAATA
jgi:N utilization substance protein A